MKNVRVFIPILLIGTLIISQMACGDQSSNISKAKLKDLHHDIISAENYAKQSNCDESIKYYKKAVYNSQFLKDDDKIIFYKELSASLNMSIDNNDECINLLSYIFEVISNGDVFRNNRFEFVEILRKIYRLKIKDKVKSAFYEKGFEIIKDINWKVGKYSYVWGDAYCDIFDKYLSIEPRSYLNFKGIKKYNKNQHISGKVICILDDEIQGIMIDRYMMSNLPEEIKAETPQEVNTIILSEHRSTEVGYYYDPQKVSVGYKNTKAYRRDIKIKIINTKTSEILYKKEIFSYPAKTISLQPSSVSGDVRGIYPTEEIDKFIIDVVRMIQ
jgi:hypothetical protein